MTREVIILCVLVNLLDRQTLLERQIIYEFLAWIHAIIFLRKRKRKLMMPQKTFHWIKTRVKWTSVYHQRKRRRRRWYSQKAMIYLRRKEVNSRENVHFCHCWQKDVLLHRERNLPGGHQFFLEMIQVLFFFPLRWCWWWEEERIRVGWYRQRLHIYWGIFELLFSDRYLQIWVKTKMKELHK